MYVKAEVKTRETRDSFLVLLGSMCAVEEFLSLVSPDSLFSWTTSVQLLIPVSATGCYHLTHEPAASTKYLWAHHPNVSAAGPHHTNRHCSDFSDSNKTTFYLRIFSMIPLKVCSVLPSYFVLKLSWDSDAKSLVKFRGSRTWWKEIRSLVLFPHRGYWDVLFGPSFLSFCFLTDIKWMVSTGHYILPCHRPTFSYFIMP